MGQVEESRFRTEAAAGTRTRGRKRSRPARPCTGPGEYEALTHPRPHMLKAGGAAESCTPCLAASSGVRGSAPRSLSITRQGEWQKKIPSGNWGLFQLHIEGTRCRTILLQKTAAWTPYPVIRGSIEQIRVVEPTIRSLLGVLIGYVFPFLTHTLTSFYPSSKGHL